MWIRQTEVLSRISTYTALVGTQYKWLKPSIFPEWEIALRAGYWYAQTPIPDATFSPALPDANQHVLTAGLGLSCKGTGKFLGYIPCGSSKDAMLGIKEIGFAVAYQAMLYDTRTVHGSATPFAPPGTADGHLSIDVPSRVHHVECPVLKKVLA